MKFKLLLAYISEFIRDGYYLAVFLLLPFIQKDIHLNLFQVGTFQTVVNLFVIIIALPTVTLLIKYGEIKLLFVSLLLYALGFLGFYFSHSYINLLLVFSIMGIGFAFYTPTSSHIRSTWFDKNTRGRDLGNLMAIGDIGKVLFSIFIGILAVVIGWRVSSFYIGVATGILFILLYFVYIKNEKKERNSIKSSEEKIEQFSYFHFLKQKKIFYALLCGNLDEGVNTPFYAFLPFLLLSKGVSITFIGEFTAIYYVGNIISRLIFGRLVDKIGDAKILIYLEISMAIFTFLITFLNSIFLICLCALILGIITEGTDPATSSMLAQALENIKNPHKVSGIRSIGNGLSRAIFPFILGLIATKAGIIYGFYVLAFMSLLPIIPAYIFLKEQN